MNLIYPRSPQETMCGWHYLPRMIDKIRLHAAGKLHADYQDNLGKGFDALWCVAAGLKYEDFVAVVKASVCDGEVCDWVRINVVRTQAQKDAHWADMLSRPKGGDEAAQARFQMRLREANCEHRSDIKSFVALIDVDEKRL